MIIFPAIDLYGGSAVRLYTGDYEQMTVYDTDPVNTVRKFEAAGATHLHMVDLEGARDGGTPNLKTIERIAASTDMFIELGGGIRSIEVIEKYLDAGIDRLILGTAAVADSGFARDAAARFGDKIAAGADIKDGRVAVKGWTETSEYTCDEFCLNMQKTGIRTLICTDISRDGAMRGANRRLYAGLSEKFSMDIIASGGVSTLDDVAALAGLGIYGAIIGTAYYIGAIDLARAIEIGKESTLK